ncbi:hypothetical protein C1645_787625 [Glomus cerebriforme]|uniref:Ion transport domain-containing protein n=1 Tax=Glomus cerebriforme TaxID=658196 RepID=A0A397SEV8_9GLOM|nr:hypothetical protein C1645_787625 [Glomus cerebriforme]
MSFAHSFYILLSPELEFSFENYTNNSDPNNPWNLVATYNIMLENGIMDSNSYMIQTPNENTNKFISYKTALFAMYLFLTGDSSALSNRPYINNPTIILTVLFLLLIVVYLMNLFIGLLNMAIDNFNSRISYLTNKAELLAEIELFYLLPHHRRWKPWFPDMIYYYANTDKAREEIKILINKGQWKTLTTNKMKRKLFKILNIDMDEKKLKNL